MFNKACIMAALAALILSSPAEARHRHHSTPQTAQRVDPGCNKIFPCELTASNNPFSGARSIRVTMHRERKASLRSPTARVVAFREAYPQETHKASPGLPKARETTFYPSEGVIGGRPSRFVAGRLVCAVNVGVALAERGIKGTGSALALSYLRWGHSAGGPVPGAVIVSARRGGGHVAIVSRVESGIVYAWNATGGQRGWREIPYRHRVLDYRLPG